MFWYTIPYLLLFELGLLFIEDDGTTVGVVTGRRLFWLVTGWLVVTGWREFDGWFWITVGFGAML